MARVGVVVSLSLIANRDASLLIGKRYYREKFTRQKVDTVNYTAVYKGTSYLVITTGGYRYQHNITISLIFDILYTTLCIQNNRTQYKYMDYEHYAVVETTRDSKMTRKHVNRPELADVWADFNIVFGFAVSD